MSSEMEESTDFEEREWRVQQEKQRFRERV